ncbi:MAG: hypothetical protein NTZ56_00095 [Acidobacteria bacterium]|nr:hypothetical protein [Acidobacteriota bacterium]
MKQFNMNVDAEFERDLGRIMKKRGWTRKSDAVRAVVREMATVIDQGDKPWQSYDWARLLGSGLRAPLSPAPRFTSDDQLWS